MKKRVFIAGSMSIKHLDTNIQLRLDKVADQDLEVLVGDADGVDTSIQH
jgi:hypothetical protein